MSFNCTPLHVESILLIVSNTVDTRASFKVQHFSRYSPRRPKWVRNYRRRAFLCWVVGWKESQWLSLCLLCAYCLCLHTVMTYWRAGLWIRNPQQPELPPNKKDQKPLFALLHFQIEKTVCILKVTSCDGVPALIGSSVTLVSNSSLEHYSWEKKKLKGQCPVMSRVICQLIIL